MKNFELSSISPSIETCDGPSLESLETKYFEAVFVIELHSIISPSSSRKSSAVEVSTHENKKYQ